MSIDQLNWVKDNFENIENAWEGDLWDRRCLGEQLTNYVDRLNCGAVLALDARWGEGKTWFVRHWAKHLTDTEHNVVYLDAFANDYLDDPFLVITSEIANILKKDKSTKRRVSKLIELSASVGTTLLPSLSKVALTLGLHLVGAGLLSGVLKQSYESAKEGIDTLSEEASDRIKESIQDKIAGHEAEKKTLIEFKKHLASTVEKLDKPLVFIIDKLDRCRPDFSIRLIERIKHFFDIPKIVFILVVDKTQFSKVVCHNYGYDEKLGEGYLDKFVDFTIKLKSTSNEVDYFETVVKDLFIEVLGYSYEKLERNNLYHECRAYIQATNFSKRELKNKIHQFSLIKLNDNKKDSIILGTLFFRDSDDLFQSIYHAIHNYTDLMIRVKNSEFAETWYETDRYQKSNLMLNVWNELFSTQYSIVYFINDIKQKVDMKDSFISSPELMHRETILLNLLKPYCLNTLYQANQFDLKCKQYIESGITF